jgi:hypothetical protein
MEEDSARRCHSPPDTRKNAVAPRPSRFRVTTEPNGSVIWRRSVATVESVPPTQMSGGWLAPRLSGGIVGTGGIREPAGAGPDWTAVLVQAAPSTRAVSASTPPIVHRARCRSIEGIISIRPPFRSTLDDLLGAVTIADVARGTLPDGVRARITPVLASGA